MAIIHKNSQLDFAKPKTVAGRNLLERETRMEGGLESPAEALPHAPLAVLGFFSPDFPVSGFHQLLATWLELLTDCPWTVPSWARLQPSSPHPHSTSETDGAVTRETLPGSSKRDAGFTWSGGMLPVEARTAETRRAEVSPVRSRF